jgi:hypothetical protein
MASTFSCIIPSQNLFQIFRKTHKKCIEVKIDTPPNSLIDSNANPKVKTMEEGVGACSLTCSISGVKGHARALRWGLERVTSGSIIHTNVHKPNNKSIIA